MKTVLWACLTVVCLMGCSSVQKTSSAERSPAEAAPELSVLDSLIEVGMATDVMQSRNCALVLDLKSQFAKKIQDVREKKSKMESLQKEFQNSSRQGFGKHEEYKLTLLTYRTAQLEVLYSALGLTLLEKECR